MNKNLMLILLGVAGGALLASCNAGADDGYGYDECYDSFNCDYPYYDTVGTSQANTSDAVAQINTVIGGNRTVDLVIQSKHPVTNLTIDNLSSLPSEWSSNSFSCNNLDATHKCILTLQYSPTAASNGKLNLKYSYTTANNTRHLSYINLDYVATEANNINAVVPAIIETSFNSSKSVVIPFVSDNSYTVTNLQVTQGLANLASDSPSWSAPATFSCNNVANGQCVLNLTYTPTVSNESGSLLLKYNYVNDHNQTIQAEAKVIYRATN